MSFPGLFALILALSCMPAITATSCRDTSPYSTQSHYEHVLSNYLNIWNGDLSLINSTFSPNISVHADRFPSPTGVGSVPLSATTSADFEAFAQRARNGWDKYTFVPYKWVAGENKIAVRWMLDAIMGANFTLAPTTLKQGDPLTYNGTDFLVLDECTGLIDEAHIAQDLITLFHNLGLTAVTV